MAFSRSALKYNCLQMTIKSVMLLSLVVLHNSLINGKARCKLQLMKEWQPQSTLYVVNWTLTENICMDFYGDCWFLDANTEMNTSDHHVFPQICPLQIQLGDSLAISSEPSLQYSEINLMNVSEVGFINCLQNTTAEDQLLFGFKLSGMHTVNPQWLSVGAHYFITVMSSGPSLCQLGLRLNLTVKEHHCQESLSSEFCSGHGKCLSEIWNKTYSCHCQPPFSGEYCQELDACVYKPCQNKDNCINKREEWNKQGYGCIWDPIFTGTNCSEMIGQCQPHICFHGICSNITAKSFICDCDEQISGIFCEESMESCVSQPCCKRKICQSNSSAFVCLCLEEFLGRNCETEVNECSSIPCQNVSEHINITKDVTCICIPIWTGKFFQRLQTSCETFLCKNNVTCMECEKYHHCSYLPGFAGKNCEKLIGHCILLSINCLNEGWCFNIIGRFRCVCIPEYTTNSGWFLRNVCLIHWNPCCSGSTFCISQNKGPPHVKYVWQLGFTGLEGEKCEVITGTNFFLVENCTEDNSYVNKFEDLDYVCCFSYEGTVETCANGYNCLIDEDIRRYWFLCIPRCADKVYLENVTGCQGSRCQQEDICKDENNRLSWSCPLRFIGRSCIPNFEHRLGNWSTSVHGFYLDHLHNCSYSGLQISRGNICEIANENCKAIPCKNGASRMHLTGYFFSNCAPGFAELSAIIKCWDKPCQNRSLCEDHVSGSPCNYSGGSIAPETKLDCACNICTD